MTYVELIVVLAIFAILSSVVMFNYGNFQAKVDIKNLGSDIALKIVRTQGHNGKVPGCNIGFIIPIFLSVTGPEGYSIIRWVKSVL